MAEADACAHEDTSEARDLPRFCKSNWRQMVAALWLTSAIIMGLAVKSYADAESMDEWMLVAGRPQDPGGPSGPTGTARGPNDFGAATAGAALPEAADPNVRLVSSTQRTAFNLAVRRVQPSVVGLRAALGSTSGAGAPIERIGSAVVVDPAGYAVTCQHVVAGAVEIKASRYPQSEKWLNAELVASEGDLALIRIDDTTPFEPAQFANAADLTIGDWVLAVGYPFGLGLTVTAGIVSRKDAALNVPGGRQYSGLVQTDAPTNEGSSGGPLVNTAGQVVGLSTAIYSPTGVFSGASFAMPSDVVRLFVERGLQQARRAGGVPGTACGRWGMGLSDLTPDLGARLGYPSTSGVLVTSIDLDSAADTAQLAKGDVVVSIADRPATNVAAVEQIRNEIGAMNAISIQVWRQGRTQTLTLRPFATQP